MNAILVKALHITAALALTFGLLVVGAFAADAYHLPLIHAWALAHGSILLIFPLYYWGCYSAIRPLANRLQYTEASKIVGMTNFKPPQPDTNKVPRYVDETAVECIYSDDLHHRAVLLSDSANNFRVRCEKWDVSEWETSGIGFWMQVTQGTTMTDSIDTARLLARERLLELGARLCKPVA